MFYMLTREFAVCFRRAETMDMDEDASPGGKFAVFMSRTTARQRQQLKAFDVQFQIYAGGRGQSGPAWQQYEGETQARRQEVGRPDLLGLRGDVKFACLLWC